MTTCSHPLKAFMLGLIDGSTNNVNVSNALTAKRRSLEKITPTEETRPVSEKDTQSILNGYLNSDKADTLEEKSLSNLITQISDTNNQKNLQVSEIERPLAKNRIGNGLLHHTDTCPLTLSPSLEDTRDGEVVNPTKDISPLNVDLKKNDEIADSGGEYNDDTDTETLTPESSEESILFELDKKVPTEPPEKRPEVATEATTAEMPFVSQGEVNKITLNSTMDYFVHDSDEDSHLTTSITVGDVSPPTRIAGSDTYAANVVTVIPEEEDLSSYVLRINTGDEIDRDIIHATSWDEGEGVEDSSTDSDSGIFKARCVDVNTSDKTLLTNSEIGVKEIDPLPVQQEEEMPTKGKEIIFDSGSLQKIEVERRRIIANQVVRSKKIDSWLHHEGDDEEEDDVDDVDCDDRAFPIDPQETVPNQGVRELFVARPVVVESQSTETLDGRLPYCNNSFPAEEPIVFEERIAREHTFNIGFVSGEANDGDSIDTDQAFPIETMSVDDEQLLSLDTNDYNTHEPDSLDIIVDSEINQHVSDSDSHTLMNGNEALTNGLDTNDIIISDMNDNLRSNRSAPLLNNDVKSKVVGMNGSLSTAPWQETHGRFVRETIIDREVRLALEREEEFRKELSRKTITDNTETNGHKHPKMVINDDANSLNAADKAAYFKTKVLSEIRNRDTVFCMENGTKTENGLSNGTEEPSGNAYRDNPLETVIQREIRLHKEREQALMQERQMAQMAAQMRNQLTLKPVRENCFKNGFGINSSPTQFTSDRELKDQKLREDDLWLQRQKFNASDSGIESPLNSDPCLTELGGGSSDGENSHDGLLPMFHQRAESLDSLGSAGIPSSNSSTSAEPPVIPRRQVKVKPLLDEEEERTTYQVLKESPIEREIRLAREREETLRREKGLPVSPSSQLPHSLSVDGLLAPGTKKAATAAAASWVRSRAMDLNNPKEQRDVQRRLATSRIQQEIEEQTQRELALRASGSIRTTSEDHVDSKVTRLSELMELNANGSPAKFSVASSPSTPDSELTDSGNSSSSSPSNNIRPSSGQGSGKTNTLPAHSNGRLFIKAGGPFTPVNGSTTATLPRRPIAGTNKGVMQKFIASRGKVIPAFSSPREKSNSVSHLHMYSDTVDCSREQLMKEIRAPPSSRTFRRTHCTAESKIQKELQQMKMREDELKLVRAKTFAMSQPNLLSLIDDDMDDIPISNGFREMSTREKSTSNPNLLDDDSSDMPDSQLSQGKPPVCRRRSALIAQWEEKIQQNCEN